MTYSEKLRLPQWQKKRLEILQRDNFTCLECGAQDKPLQVHHVVYRKIDPWMYPDYLYQTLCEDHHAAKHAAVEKIVDAIRIAIKNTPIAKLEASAQKLCDEALLEISIG